MNQKTSWRLVGLCVIPMTFVSCGARRVPPPTVVRIVETVEVKVPVLVNRTPPAELLAPLHPPLPVFIDPADPTASSALTVEDERLFRGLVVDLKGRIKAWEAFWTAEEPSEPASPLPTTAVAEPLRSDSCGTPTDRDARTIVRRSRRLLHTVLAAVGSPMAAALCQPTAQD